MFFLIVHGKRKNFKSAYQYLVYNLTVTINCVPRYYLEPNNLIYIDDKQSKIRGDFVIT